MTWSVIQPAVHFLGMVGIVGVVFLYACSWFYRQGRRDERTFNECEDWSLFLTRSHRRNPYRRGCYLPDGRLTSVAGALGATTAEMTRVIWSDGPKVNRPKDLLEASVLANRRRSQVQSLRRTATNFTQTASLN